MQLIGYHQYKQNKTDLCVYSFTLTLHGFKLGSPARSNFSKLVLPAGGAKRQQSDFCPLTFIFTLILK